MISITGGHFADKPMRVLVQRVRVLPARLISLTLHIRHHNIRATGLRKSGAPFGKSGEFDKWHTFRLLPKPSSVDVVKSVEEVVTAVVSETDELI